MTNLSVFSVLLPPWSVGQYQQQRDVLNSQWQNWNKTESLQLLIIDRLTTV